MVYSICSKKEGVLECAAAVNCGCHGKRTNVACQPFSCSSYRGQRNGCVFVSQVRTRCDAVSGSKLVLPGKHTALIGPQNQLNDQGMMSQKEKCGSKLVCRLCFLILSFTSFFFSYFIMVSPHGYISHLSVATPNLQLRGPNMPCPHLCLHSKLTFQGTTVLRWNEGFCTC